VHRFIFNLLVLISLLLCAGIVAVWADSYRGTRMVEVARGAEVVQWASDSGVAILHWTSPADGEVRWQSPSPRWQLLGLAWIEGRLARRIPWHMLIIPYWLPALLTAGLPVVWLSRRYHQKRNEERVAAGLCPRCAEPLDMNRLCRPCLASEDHPPDARPTNASLPPSAPAGRPGPT
jgi:hypothetical protein